MAVRLPRIGGVIAGGVVGAIINAFIGAVILLVILIDQTIRPPLTHCRDSVGKLSRRAYDDIPHRRRSMALAVQPMAPSGV